MRYGITRRYDPKEGNFHSLSNGLGSIFRERAGAKRSI